MRCCSDYQGVLFADETSFFLSSNIIENLIVNVKCTVHKYKERLEFDANKLTLNAKKFITLFTKGINVPILTQILHKFIDRKVIEKVNKNKFLGITLDCNLSWIDYVGTITQKKI